MVRDLDTYLFAILGVVRNPTAGFPSATSSVFRKHSATLHQDVSSMLMHLDGLLEALASKHLVKTFSDHLDSGKAPPLS